MAGEVPTTAWSETSPAGSDNISLGDNRIREMKTQIREVIDVDHDFPSDAYASDVGQHKRVTLQEQADLGTGAEGVPILGAQTVDGNAELVFTTEGDEDIQFTKGDYPYYSAPENVAGMAGIMNLIYPIGSVVTLGVSTNPGTLFGVGTWTAIEGKVIVGIDSGTFTPLNDTGGSETVDASHTHVIDKDNVYTLGQASSTAQDGRLGLVDYNEENSNYNYINSDITSESGGSSTQSTLQPYIVKYVWERTS